MLEDVFKEAFDYAPKLSVFRKIPKDVYLPGSHSPMVS
jgi:hypothetical protein